MGLSTLIIIGIMIVSAYLQNKSVDPLIRDIENIATKNGKDGNYSRDWRFRWKLALSPRRILSSTDSEEMRQAKERLLAEVSMSGRKQLLTVLAILAVLLGIIGVDALKALLVRH